MNFVMLREQTIDFPGKPTLSFVSNRLARLIHKKSLRGKWKYTYFRLPAGEVMFGDWFSGKLVSNKGTVLFTKDF
jgi:hypothetical protein